MREPGINAETTIIVCDHVGATKSRLELRMLFRRKSKAASAAPVAVPAPVPMRAPIVNAGEPDMLSLGRAVWRSKGKIFAFTLITAAAAFTVVNAMTPRYRSEARLLLEAKQNAFSARRSRQEHAGKYDRSGGGDQPDPGGVVARSRARGDQKGKAYRQAGIRSGGERLADCGPCSRLSASPAIRAACRPRSARSKRISTGSASMRSRSRASSPSISTPPTRSLPPASPMTSPRRI